MYKRQDLLFHLAMAAGELDRAVAVAETGEWLANLRYGKGSPEVNIWTTRRVNPIASVLNS